MGALELHRNDEEVAEAVAALLAQPPRATRPSGVRATCPRVGIVGADLLCMNSVGVDARMDSCVAKSISPASNAVSSRRDDGMIRNLAASRHQHCRTATQRAVLDPEGTKFRPP